MFSTAADYETKPVNRLDLNSGMIIEDLKVGEGAAALPKALVTFHYRGKLMGGDEFDCTLTREGGPQPEVQALDKLFDGLAAGMIGMKPGGRRRLTIPPMLARGIVGMKDSEGKVLIPPDATLIYVIDVVDIKQQLVTAPPAPPASPAPSAAPAAPSTPAPAKP
jgi:FKBP-type peptidyl-prolyl cis-trans isomerase